MNPRRFLVILLLTAPLLTPTGPAHAADDAAQYLNTGTFQKREGEWRAVAWQATRVPQAD